MGTKAATRKSKTGQPTPAAVDTRYRERTIAAQDGVALYVRDYGDPNAPRPPMLCLTGLTRNSRDYHDFASRHAPDRRVITLDYRGRGRSAHDPDWRNYKPEVYLNDIRHVLAATNCHHVVVVGTSLGAMLAMGMALAVPSALGGAILNDAGPEVDPAGIARILDYVGDESGVAGWDAATARMKTLFPSVAIDTDAGWREFAERTFREGDDGLLYYDWDTKLVNNLREARELPNLWPFYRALRGIPVLAFRGEISDVLSPETFERMGEDMPKLTRVVVPGVGHVPSLAEPVSTRAINDFLKAL